VVLSKIAEFEKAAKEAIKQLREYGFGDEAILPTLILKLKQVAESEGCGSSAHKV